MLNLTHLEEAWRIFKRSRRVKKKGVKKYKGDAKEICKQTVKSCWNGQYFQVSSGHFCEFYIRDFGWCVDSLLKLGYKKEVLKTLEYALNIYSKQGLKTTITPKGKAIDVFIYSPDTLAYLIRSLRVANAKSLVKKYEDFLKVEINKYNERVLDSATGLVRSDKYFGSMKDESKRISSCYDNVMTAMLSNELDRLKFYNPFKKFDYKQMIKKMFWNGKFFIDDLTGHQIVTGDTNLMPFWTGVFTDKKMMKSAFGSMQKAGLDTPFPLKYSSGKFKEHKMNIVSKFVEGYEHDSVWMHIGPLYVQLLKQLDKKKANESKKIYAKLIEKNKNFLEIFDSKGKPFKSPFYYSDESMLWAANYLTL